MRHCVKRLNAELSELLRNPLPDIYVSARGHDIRFMDALIIGPGDTPYQHGFFHFSMTFPPEYPFKPPKVVLNTTDGGRVRFNPNLYACGRVCLSILGTWDGPGWTPTQSIASVLLSIQSLMNATPYCNEPGHDGAPPSSQPVVRYNHRVRFETLRVAVCGMLESPTCQGTFQDVLDRCFARNFDYYLSLAKNASRHDGSNFEDPFGEMSGAYDYAALLPRLQALLPIVQARLRASDRGHGVGPLSRTDVSGGAGGSYRDGAVSGRDGRDSDVAAGDGCVGSKAVKDGEEEQAEDHDFEDVDLETAGDSDGEPLIAYDDDDDDDGDDDDDDDDKDEGEEETEGDGDAGKKPDDEDELVKKLHELRVASGSRQRARAVLPTLSSMPR